MDDPRPTDFRKGLTELLSEEFKTSATYWYRKVFQAGFPCLLSLLLLTCVTNALAYEVGVRDYGWNPAPPFHLEDLKGELQHLSDFRGKALVVNFWASWCAPCREELPSMNRAWKVLEKENVVMLAINMGEDREAVTAFLNDYPIDFPVLLDQRGSISQRWRVSSMPTTFLVDRNGHIAHRIIGKKSWDSDQLLALVKALTQPNT